jgi:hypothetical protein
MFDTNIYGSTIRQFGKECSDIKTLQTVCHPNYYPLYSQRIWSFLRIVETINKGSIKKEFVKTLPTVYKTLYKNAETLSSELSSKTNKTIWYTKYLALYVKAIQNPIANYKVISENFSKCKYFETDAYYTIGAVLHIVENKKNINPDVLYDSIYDNLGFALEVLYVMLLLRNLK